MFKAIKEFLVGKPKVEETPVPTVTEAPVAVPATVVEPAVVEPVATVPVVEEVKVTNITLSDQIAEAVTMTVKPESVPGAWPFPNAAPEELATKKTRTPVKQKEAATTKKSATAITANSKPRKKK